METLVVVALCLSGVSMMLSAMAYWRSGGHQAVLAMRDDLTREIDALRLRERAAAENLARRIRGGYQESQARIDRAEQRLTELRREMSIDLRESIDALGVRLCETRGEIEQALERLKTDASSRSEAAQMALQKQVRRLEGRVQLLRARAEIVRAERLAARKDFTRARDLLEEAVAKVREVKVRLADPEEDHSAFNRVLDALLEAMRTLHDEATDHKRQLDDVLSASDSLLQSLQIREERLI